MDAGYQGVPMRGEEKIRDLEGYSFADLVDIDAFSQMLKSFYEATGILHGLVDAENRVISAIGWQDACTKFHRANSQSNLRCLESNLFLAEHLGDSGYVGFACKNGLVDYAAPIVVEGRQLATLYFGQILHEAPDMDFFRRQAKEFGFDESGYLEAILQVPIMSEDRVKAIMDFYAQLAQMLAQGGLDRLRQRRTEQKLTQFNKELERQVKEHTAELEAEVEARRRIDDTLRFIANRGNQGDFLNALARHLAERLDVAYVIIDRLSEDAAVAETVALYANGGIIPNMRYPLAGTPCANVIGKTLCCYPQDVRPLFPEDELLVEMGVESYAGIPLWNSEGKPLGLIAIMDNSPFRNTSAVSDLLQLVAPSAAAELERAQYEDALLAREEKFRALAENLPDPIYRYDNEGQRIYVNSKVLELAKLSFDDMVGHPLDKERLRLKFGADVDKVVACIRHVLDKGEASECEVTRLDTGEIRYFHNRYAPEFDANGKVASVIGVCRDVTAYRQALEALKVKEERLAQSQEIARLGSWDWDIVRNKVEWSDMAYDIYTPDGRPASPTYEDFLKAVHPDDRDRVDAAVRATFVYDRPFDIEHRVLSQTNGERTVQARAKVFRDAKGVPIRMAGTVHDVTTAKEAEQAMREAMDRLSESNTDLERFAYIASHDLQEPVRTVVSFTQLMERQLGDRLSAEDREIFTFVITAAKRMSQLITDLLLFSRVNARSLPFAPVPLAEACRAAIDNLHESILENQAEVRVGELPELMADKTQLIQLFQNLIGNSIKYRHADAAPKVTISAERVGGEWIVSVTDNGIGIAATDQDIFEIFRRLHSASNFPGTGVGLAVCKRIVLRHQGRIWYESSEEKGTSFHVAFPA